MCNIMYVVSVPRIDDQKRYKYSERLENIWRCVGCVWVNSKYMCHIWTPEMLEVHRNSRAFPTMQYDVLRLCYLIIISNFDEWKLIKCDLQGSW